MREMSVLRALVASMRPKQWTKNLIVFAPLIFAGELLEPSVVLKTVGAFVVFCIVSGATYIANDIRDIERDKLHAKKCKRPIACGALSVRTATWAAGVLLVVGLAGAAALGVEFLAVTVAYLALQILYSWWIKDQVILDVMAIAVGFVLRALAGAVVAGVSLSYWLYAAVSLLALFLGFAKRRHELVVLDEEARAHRPSLEHYGPQFLDALLSSVTAATIVTYAIYAAFSETAQQNAQVFLTVPFVVYGLFRYLYLIYQKDFGGNPEEVLLTDVPLIVTIVLWLLTAAAALYVL